MSVQFKLRSEAGALSDEELTNEQRRAGERACDLLIDMLRSTEKVDRPALPFLPRIDDKRSNRVLLIDGGRGSGKTALLVTLIARWRKAYLEKSALPHADPEPKFGANLGGRIVPVGLLDLDPLPPSTNLLLHVIGRLERVVEWLDGDGAGRKAPAPWHLTDSEELASRKKWRDLLRAAAAGWDGNVKERAAELDLDAYMVELEETERQRLHVVDTFAAFVDALVSDFAERHGKQPLFVLAVDDADMNPRRSVELLHTIRILWHPRLAFILTGDSDLFRQTLQEHVLADLRSPLHGHHVLEREIAALSKTRRVLGLASDMYDKVIPSGHRCVLQPLPVRRRYAQLHDVLSGIHAESAEEPALSDYFATGYKTNRSAKDLPPVFHQSCEALPARLRELIDLEDLIRGGAPATAEDEPVRPAQRASHVVQEIWRHALRAISEETEYGQDTVRVSEETGALLLGAPDPPPGVEITESRLRASRGGKSAGPKVSFMSVEHMQATGENGRVPPRVAAALMLAADVSADQTHGRWIEALGSMTGYEPIFAASSYATRTEARATVFSWPLPQGCSFLFYAAFASRWNARLCPDVAMRMARAPRGIPAKGTAELARHFLALVLYLSVESKTMRVGRSPPEWRALADGITDLMSKGNVAWSQWAECRAGLLAAPEYGLDAKDANAWLDALRSSVGAARWPSIAEKLHVERRVPLVDARAGSVERVFLEIDEAHKGHKWGTLVEARRETTRAPKSGD